MSGSIPVKKYNIDGYYMGTYKSLTSAAKSLYKSTGSDIRWAIDNNNGIYKNYKWVLVDPEETAAELEETAAELEETAAELEAAKEEEPKYTPNSVKNIAIKEGNIEFSADTIFNNTLKMIHSINIKKYLDEYEHNKSMRYIILPELLHYLIANPTLMIYNKKFRDTVSNKMKQFENDVKNVTKLGDHIVTEKYRQEVISLIILVEEIIDTTTDYFNKYNDN